MAVLLLFLWSRQNRWSQDYSKTIRVIESDKVSLRSICLDSKATRSIVSQFIPNIEGVPALLCIEYKDNTKNIAIVYKEEEITSIINILNIEKTI
jgi:uncharacterized protein (UPF0254 family)